MSSTIDPLSYSSMSEIYTCEQKYALRKVLQVPEDTDYEMQRDALDIGTVFHTALEQTQHDLSGFKYTDLLKIINEGNVSEKTGEHYDFCLNADWHGPMIFAMLRRYKNMHESQGLKPVSIECALNYKDEFLGSTDLVLEEDAGYWICDMKTSADPDRYIIGAKLKNDWQLNLYVYFYEKLMRPKKPILGCRYRVVQKVAKSFKRRPGESVKQFSDRVYGRIKAEEYIIPIDEMNPSAAYETFKRARARQKALHKNAVPLRNYKNCFDFNRPCPYWSRCHGNEYSEATVKKEVF